MLDKIFSSLNSKRFHPKPKTFQSKSYIPYPFQKNITVVKYFCFVLACVFLNDWCNEGVPPLTPPPLPPKPHAIG